MTAIFETPSALMAAILNHFVSLMTAIFESPSALMAAIESSCAIFGTALVPDGRYI
jgi:hypothetical protein